MVAETCYYNGTPSSCLDLKNDSVLEILSALSPNCDRGAWSPLSAAWKVFFYLLTSLSALLFLLLGIVCVILLLKRHSAQRFKAKTFIAIDVSLSILGFSRFLFYILDPFGIAGFCDGHVACVVTSRLLFSLGFPSLTAAYTLVFITLWHSAKMKLGRNCIQHWRLIIPLCFIHYFVAIIVEIIGAVGPYSVVFLVLTCEAVFTLWGLFVCVTFLLAGCRLLQSIKVSVRQSSIVCRERESVKEGENKHNSLKKDTLRTYSVTTMKLKARKQHKQAIRKITIITYISASLGGLYSLLTIAQLVMVSLQLFGPCPEKSSGEYHSNSDVWLLLRYISTVIEYFMAVLLIYSINDFRPIVKWITGCLCCVSKTEKEKSKNYFAYSHEETSDSSSSSKKRTLLSKDTKMSIQFVTPPATPSYDIKIENSFQNGKSEMPKDHINGKVIPATDDTESKTSVDKTEVALSGTV